ncbi:phosphoenolpyruvate--protein phosphotransferase [Oceanibacterium hippocampi]
MAGTGEAEARLNTVVRIIANNMVAEVCSVYLLRGDGVLELFATEGLNPEAVHQTRLRVGEGLIGEIARSARYLNLSDAQAHPAFAYRPETGEEIYHSLLGVPVLRGGRVVAVLAVQNRTQRHYSEEEVEALQTVAMVLAELLVSSQLFRPEDFAQTSDTTAPVRLTGQIFADGLAIGIAVLHEPKIVVDRAIADDTTYEQKRLARSIAQLREAVDAMMSAAQSVFVGESRDILEAYQMFAYDRGWLVRLQEAVASGLTAEAAIKRVQDDTRIRMEAAVDPYIRERLADLDDLANRLYAHLIERDEAKPALPDNAVIVARHMGAAEILDYDRERLRAVVLEEGATTSHVAIIARALQIPLVGNVRDARKSVESGDRIIVDGEQGQIFVRPGEEVLHAFQANLAARAARLARFAALRDQPSETLDGVRIALNVNAGLLIDMDQLQSSGADGVGLYRTEIHFMVRPRMPKIDSQTGFYRAVLNRADGKPVVFRTLDVGGDKALPYLRIESGENPAMGWRAIRLGLDRPALLQSQLRALLRAAEDRDLRIMFPMIAEVSEFVAARAILERELERHRASGAPEPRSLHLGAMVEVPSLAWQLDELLEVVDFLSVGSNDLLQFLFAVDRGNPRVAGRYDRLSPPVIAFFRHLVCKADAAGVPISVCGEMAGSPLEAMALLGLGFRNLSMNAASIGPVKEMVRHVVLTELTSYMSGMNGAQERSIRDCLGDFARRHGVPV